jgi:hypothetical protein
LERRIVALVELRGGSKARWMGEEITKRKPVVERKKRIQRKATCKKEKLLMPAM